MDLEASEATDFSSGGHHHLVRKAADSNVQIKSGQSSTSAPSEPQKTLGNPHPKMRERKDVYVVQISDETTPDESNNLASPFSDASIRRGEHKITFMEEKSKCSLKMLPQSGLLGGLT